MHIVIGMTKLIVPSIGDPGSDEDATFIRNPREVRTCGRSPTNRFRRSDGRWTRKYYHAYQECKSSQGRVAGKSEHGGGRRTDRGGRGVCINT